MRIKTYSALLFAFMTTALLFYREAPAETIVDYYNKLSDSHLKDQKYTLARNGGKWFIKNKPDYGSADDPVVDLKNGYIKTVYQGGDGAQERVIALFLKTDKTPLLGVTWYYSGAGGDYGCNFYEYRAGSWKDVTAGIFPKISYRAFLKEGFDTKPFEQLMKRVNSQWTKVGPQLVVTLPRTGTTVRVGLHVKALGGDGVNDDDLKIVDAVRKNIKYREMDLVWNMAGGVFEAGKKK